MMRGSWFAASLMATGRSSRQVTREMPTEEPARQGCGVTSSAVSMDKHLTKTVLAAAGIDVGHWEMVTARQWEADASACMDRIERLGFPVFVKPCRAGSSV